MWFLRKKTDSELISKWQGLGFIRCRDMEAETVAEARREYKDLYASALKLQVDVHDLTERVKILEAAAKIAPREREPTRLANKWFGDGNPRDRWFKY